MPAFRVIGGPYDGSEWHLACFKDCERVAMSRPYDKHIEHIYELSTNAMTATHRGWRRTERKACIRPHLHD